MRDTPHPDMAAVLDELFTPGSNRFFRAVAYSLVAYLLLWVNTYGLEGRGVIAFAIGLLGFGSRVAIIAQVALGILTLMAIIPSHLVGL